MYICTTPLQHITKTPRWQTICGEKSQSGNESCTMSSTSPVGTPTEAQTPTHSVPSSTLEPSTFCPPSPPSPPSPPLPVQGWCRRERGESQMKPFANSWRCWRPAGQKSSKSCYKKLMSTADLVKLLLICCVGCQKNIGHRPCLIFTSCCLINNSNTNNLCAVYCIHFDSQLVFTLILKYCSICCLNVFTLILQYCSNMLLKYVYFDT